MASRDDLASHRMQALNALNASSSWVAALLFFASAYEDVPVERLRSVVLVMLSSLSVLILQAKLHDDAAGESTGCAGSAREARRKWAQAPADTKEAES